MTETEINFQGSDTTMIEEGGALSTLTVEELKDNIIAIRQLININNRLERQLNIKENDIQNTKIEIEFLKASPFVSIIAAILNIAGAIQIALSINLMTSATDHPKLNSVILICGIILITIGSLSTILYPYTKDWLIQKKI